MTNKCIDIATIFHFISMVPHSFGTPFVHKCILMYIVRRLAHALYSHNLAKNVARNPEDPGYLLSIRPHSYIGVLTIWIYRYVLLLHGATSNVAVLKPNTFCQSKSLLFCTRHGLSAIFQFPQAYTMKCAQSSIRRSNQASTDIPIRLIIPTGFAAQERWKSALHCS